MFHLRFLGGASIETSAGPLAGAAAQRRRLALLALLAASPRGAMSRDKLAAYLFPEADAARASRSISDAAHALRKALGRDAIISVGEELRLEPALVTSDVAMFAQRLAAGDLAGAMSLYTGPFLDGFFVPEAPEFERWVDAERDRLGREYAHALERLAQEHEAAGDSLTAGESWRRLAVHDPLNSRVALRLMHALDGAGDRAGALRHAEAHQALLRSELGTDGDPDVDAFAERLRARRESAVRSGPARPPAPRATVRFADAIAAEPAPAPPGDAASGESASSPFARTQPARWRSPRALVLSGVVLLAAVAVGFIASWRNRAVPVSGEAIAVMPFPVRGSSAVGYLGDGMVDLLSRNLDGPRDLRAIAGGLVLATAGAEPVADPRRGRELAKRLGAGLYVIGTVFEAAGTVRIEAAIYDTEPGRLEPRHSARVQGDTASFFALVDELSADLLAGLRRGHGARLSRTAARTTSSLPALKEYFAAEQALRRALYDSAAAGFERAIGLDSAFALAHYRLAVATFALGRHPLARRAIQRALRHGTGLADREHRLIEGYDAFLDGRATDAESIYRALLVDHPDDMDATYQLAEVLLRFNPMRGLSLDEARALYDRVLESDPEAVCPVWTRVYLATRNADWDAIAAAAARTENPMYAAMARAGRLFSGNDTAAQRAYLQSVPDSHPLGITAAVLPIGALEAATRMTEVAQDAGAPGPVRLRGRLVRPQLERMAGRWPGIDAPCGYLLPGATEPPEIVQPMCALFPFLPVPDADLRVLRQRVAAWDSAIASPWPDDPNVALRPHARLYYLGAIDARLGDHAAALVAADRIETLPAPKRWTAATAALPRLLRAQVALSQNRPEDALRHLDDDAPLPPPELQVPLFQRELDRWWHAEALFQAGRDAEALRWYSNAFESAWFENEYAAFAALRAAQLHERLGRTADAAAAYARVIRFWQDADPALQPVVAQARGALARLTGDHASS